MMEQMGGIEKMSVKERLVKSGIAERMIETIKKYKGTLDPEITFGVDDCNFKVEEFQDPSTNEIHTQIVIDKPNLHEYNKMKQPRVSRAFSVKNGESFGAGGEPPLTTEQFALIQEIVKEQSDKTN